MRWSSTEWQLPIKTGKVLFFPPPTSLAPPPFNQDGHIQWRHRTDDPYFGQFPLYGLYHETELSMNDRYPLRSSGRVLRILVC